MGRSKMACFVFDSPTFQTQPVNIAARLPSSQPKPSRAGETNPQLLHLDRIGLAQARLLNGEIRCSPQKPTDLLEGICISFDYE
jgi:hypothetical protein